MREMRLLGGLGRGYTGKRPRIALVAFCEEVPPLVTRCGTVMMERRAVRLVRNHKKEVEPMAEIRP